MRGGLTDARPPSWADRAVIGQTPTIDRRAFLRSAAAVTATGLAGRTVLAPAARAAEDVFLHGIASGDPLADRVVIWTRVTPEPAATPGSGVGPPVDVRWEVSSDPAFSTVVASGSVTTDATRDHTVAVDVTGLAPGTDHWYRFHAAGTTSGTARTRTAPAPGAVLDCVRLGVVTCAEYEFGYFGSYRHLAARDDIDAVLHMGDYIYEFGVGYGSPPTSLPTPGPAIGRAHEPATECLTLADYRTRYGQYRRDPDLQALHAAHPVIVMYDDHEVANDAWRDGAQNHQPEEGSFAERAAAARQAWREWLPVRRVDDDAEVVHRSFRFGDLAELWMLDVRRYRDAPPDNVFFSYGSVDPAIDDPSRTMLGDDQREWLLGGLTQSDAAWKLLGNPVPFFPLVIGPSLASTATTLLGPLAGTLPPLPPPLAVDDWNGYAGERRALIGAIVDTPVTDVVIVTGDYHETFVADIPEAPGDYLVDGNSVAVEFVAPAVTSPGLAETFERGGFPEGAVVDAAFRANLTANNPWVRHHEGRSNGFGVLEVTEARALYDFWYLADRLDPTSAAAPASSWEVLRGTAKAAPAAAPLPARPRSGTAATPGSAPDQVTGGASPAATTTIPATGVDTATFGVAAAAAAAAALAARRAGAAARDDASPP